MKRLFITIIIAVSAFTAANAQYANNAKYRDLKEVYDHKEYVKQATDPYNVGWYDCASFFVPGIGQFLSGEIGRGLAFIGGEAILMSLIVDAASTIDEIAITNEKGFITGYTDEKKGRTNMIVLLSSLGADLGLAIWSSIDARRIVKVKNMYYQDFIGHENPVELGFSPSVSFVPSPTGSIQPNAGIALNITF